MKLPHLFVAICAAQNRLLARFHSVNVLWNLWIIQIDANKCCLLLERAQNERIECENLIVASSRVIMGISD